MRVLLPLLLACAMVYSANLGAPLVRHAESNLTLFGKHARNFEKFGGMAPLEVSGPRLEYYDDYRRYHYIEHPPGTAWLVRLSTVLFGTHEWSVRLPFAALALAGVLLFWRVSRRLLGRGAAELATVFFGLSPMYAYFSVVTGHQITTMICLLGGLLFYLRWLDSRSRRDLVFLFAFQVAGCGCDWPGYYLALALAAHALFVERKAWKVAAAAIALNLAVFGAYLGWVYSLDPDGGSCVKRLLFAGSSRSASLPLAGYAAGEIREIFLYFTVPVIVLSGIWITRCARRASGAGRLIPCLPLLAVDEIVFRQLCASHDFYSYYLILFLAPSAAQATWAAAGRLRSQGRSRVFVALAVALFMIQSAWVLSDRTTKLGGYLFYRDLGLALTEETSPEARVLILVDDIPHYTAYYGDRFALRYFVAARVLQYENLGKRFPEIPPEQLPDFVEAHRDEFDVIVAGRTDRAAGGNAFFRNLGLHPDVADHVALMEKFHVLPPGSALERCLDRLGVRSRVNRGLTFYFLRP